MSACGSPFLSYLRQDDGVLEFLDTLPIGGKGGVCYHGVRYENAPG